MMNFLRILVETSITMGIITVILLIFLPFLNKKYSPKTIYYSLVIVAIGYLFIFRPQMPSSIFTVPVPANANYSTFLNSKSTVYSSRAANAQISWYHILFSLWLFGALSYISTIFYRHFKFLLFIRRWGYEPREEQLSILSDARKSLLIASTTKLIICPVISTPLLIGLFRNLIILPETNFNNKELELIFKHELIHLKKRDLIVKILLILVLAIHWFNPIIWIFSKVILFYCEASCDYTLTFNMTFDDKQYYGGVILNTIRNGKKFNTILSSQFNGGKQAMKKRLESIINSTPKKIGVTLLVTVVFISLCAGMIFTFQVKSNATAKKTPEIEANYSIGKSDDYEILEQLASIDKNTSVKEYNNKIEAICHENNIELNEFLSKLFSSISNKDTLFDFLATSLLYSSSELYSEIVGNELPSISTHATKSFPDELTTEELKALKNELSSEEYEEYLNGEMIFGQSYNLDYYITYEIYNPSAITAIERDDILNSVISEVQEKINTLTITELDNNPKDSLKLFLKDLTTKYSNDNIGVECTYDNFFKN